MRHFLVVALDVVGGITLIIGLALGIAALLTAIDARRERW